MKGHPLTWRPATLEVFLPGARGGQGPPSLGWPWLGRTWSTVLHVWADAPYCAAGTVLGTKDLAEPKVPALTELGSQGAVNKHGVG